jgi:uroporphyrin-III C-methyltransferase
MIRKIYIIGAGPGDKDLITVKALKILNQATFVLVDDLVNQEILSFCPKAEIINVGKRGGCLSTPQEFINRLMVSRVKNEEVVVRLKGGDPLIFGRLGEEIQYLDTHGIDVEVIPGITSAVGIAAKYQFSLTHRDMAHGVTFITGHTIQKNAVNWNALVQSQTTIAIYMGLKNIQKIIISLLESGLRKSMPVVIVQNGLREGELFIRTTFECLSNAAKELNQDLPTIFFIGEAVSLASNNEMLEKTNWKEFG